MSSSRAAVCCLCLCLVLVAAGCGSEPNAAGLGAGATIDATSARGLATGKLSVVGDLTIGENDFELVLAPEAKTDAAKLESLTAMMPAHGHVTTPDAIDATDGTYRIVALPLSMPGVWRLTGSLSVDGTGDTISFDVDVP